MLRKRVTVLVGAAVMVLSMFAASAPVFAQGIGGCDPNPGQSEDSDSIHTPPPFFQPGSVRRSSEANERDTSGLGLFGLGTGFGERVEECA